MAKNTVHSLNYRENLSEDYQKLIHLPGFVLLESSDRVRGRYDILSAYPYECIKLEEADPCSEQLFSQLEARLTKAEAVGDLPFQGGAIGYFSYDLGAKLAGISFKPQESLRSLPLMEVGLYDWAIITDHLLRKVSLFAANEVYATATIVEEVIALWEGKAVAQRPTFRLLEPFVPLISKKDYRKAVEKIHHDLSRGRAYQVNYTQPFTAVYSGSTWEMYQQVRATNPVPYSAYYKTGGADVLSFSPERFLTMDNGLIMTSPIKGTEKRSANPEKDAFLKRKLVACSKNQAENVMIVDLMRNDLGKIALPGSVKVKALCAVESYQYVHHLVSHVEALCDPALPVFSVFAACFPGGSITGAPKLESMKVIAEQELYARGIYCGSIGYFSRHGRFDSNIAIRTVTATRDRLHLAAGGAIVIDSQWEQEYEECFTKIAAIVKN